MYTDNPFPPTFNFYSVLVIGLVVGPLFVVLWVKEAHSSRKNSRSGSKPNWACMGVWRRREGCLMLPVPRRQSPGTCRVTPRGLLASAVSLMHREGSTSGPSQLMWLLLLIRLLLCALQSFWLLYQWSCTKRRKVRSWHVACRLFSHLFVVKDEMRWTFKIYQETVK